MALSNLKVVLQTATQTVFNGIARSVTIHIADGVIILQSGKSPYFTSFDRCDLDIETIDLSKHFQLKKGSASLDSDRLTVVAEMSEPQKDVKIKTQKKEIYETQ